MKIEGKNKITEVGKKGANFLKKHKPEILCPQGIYLGSLAKDIKLEELLRKDENYKQERKKLDEFYSQSIRALKTKYALKYSEKGLF